MLDKMQVARRQLGAALHLFLADMDPVSVHTLACSGAEIAHGLAELSGSPPFQTLAIQDRPTLTESQFKGLRNRYWNVFKHYADRRGGARDDTLLLEVFDDSENDAVLFIGWTDLATALGRMPIEAQVFQAWFFAVRPEVLAPDAQIAGLNRVFSGITAMPRSRKKELLRKVARKYLRDEKLRSNPLTERRSLLLPNNFHEAK